MLDLEAQKLIVDGKLRCWFDIDVNDTRAAYQRAVDFVGAKNLAYNLSSVCGTTLRCIRHCPGPAFGLCLAT